MSLANLIPGVAQLKAALRFLPLIGMTACLIVAAIQWGNARHHAKRADNLTGLLATEQANHAVTRGSVDTLKAALATKNAESEARAQSLEAAKRKAARDTAEAETRYRATKSLVERLRASGASEDRPACEVSEEAREALQSL